MKWVGVIKYVLGLIATFIKPKVCTPTENVPVRKDPRLSRKATNRRK